MARFSRALTAALTQPSFGHGLFTAGNAMGGYGTNRNAVQDTIMKEKASQGLMSAAGGMDFGNPAQNLGALTQLGAKAGVDSTEAKAAYAERLQAHQAEQKRISDQQKRELVTQQLRARGLNDLADRVSAGAADVEEALKVARDEEIAEAVRARGVGGRKAVARRMGITDFQFNEIGLADMSDDQFENWRQGNSAKTQPYQTPQGDLAIFRENEAGLVYDENSGNWVNPSALGLSVAPSLQRIENLENTLAPELAKIGVKRYADLLGGADTAKETLRNIATVFPMVDGAITGFAAEQRLDLARVAALLGDDPSAVVDTETYISQAAPRVAEIIKAFGSGTGLSDKDREFAELAAAGKITMNAASMKRVLRILDKAARGKLENLNQVTDSMAALLPANQRGILDVYRSLGEMPPALGTGPSNLPEGFVLD